MKNPVEIQEVHVTGIPEGYRVRIKARDAVSHEDASVERDFDDIIDAMEKTLALLRKGQDVIAIGGVPIFTHEGDTNHD